MNPAQLAKMSIEGHGRALLSAPNPHDANRRPVTVSIQDGAIVPNMPFPCSPAEARVLGNLLLQAADYAARPVDRPYDQRVRNEDGSVTLWNHYATADVRPARGSDPFPGGYVVHYGGEDFGVCADLAELYGELWLAAAKEARAWETGDVCDNCGDISQCCECVCDRSWRHSNDRRST